LIVATEKELEKIVREVSRRTRSPLGKDEIGKKVGKVIGRYRMGKHFILAIGRGPFPMSAMKSRWARKRRWMGFMWFAPVNRQIVFPLKTPFVLIRILPMWNELSEV